MKAKIIMKTNTNKNLLMEENQQTVYEIDFEMKRATYFKGKSRSNR